MQLYSTVQIQFSKSVPVLGSLCFTFIVSCRLSSGQQGATEHKPTLEETVESLFRRLREKRRALGLPDNTKVCFPLQHVDLSLKV